MFIYLSFTYLFKYVYFQELSFLSFLNILLNSKELCIHPYLFCSYLLLIHLSIFRNVSIFYHF